jgi:major membrane immunogen (membrane-anchored lipoprotein)
MFFSRKWGLVMSLLTISLASVLALAGCSLGNLSSGENGDGNRSASRGRMSEKDASADCLSQLEELIASSDADGLVAAFSDEARASDADLQAQAEEFMTLVGGGTMSDQDFHMSRGAALTMKRPS